MLFYLFMVNGDIVSLFYKIKLQNSPPLNSNRQEKTQYIRIR